MTDERESAIHRLLEQGASISEIAKETDISRPTIRKIARAKFPDLYWPRNDVFEVEIDPDEEPAETVAYYEQMGRKFLDKRKGNPKAKRSGWILTFSKRNKPGK